MRFPRLARAGVAAVCLTLVGTLVSPVSTANAGTEDRKRRVDSSIRSLQNDLEDTSADLKAAYGRLLAVQAKLPGARADVARAEEQLGQARERDAAIGRQLKVAAAKVGKAADDLAATARSTTSTHATLGSLARQAYQTGGVGELSVALQATSADDFAQRVAFVDTAMKLQGQALAQLDVERAETAAKQARLVAVRRQVATLKAQAEASVIRARAAEQAAAAAKSRLDALVRSQAAEVHAISVRKAAERRRLDALEAQSRALQRELARLAAAQLAAARRARLAKRHSSQGGGGGGEAVGAASGILSPPVSGARVSSEFGRRFHPILRYWRLHAGMDFAVGCGTPVYAPASGTIVSAGWAGGYGNRIVVSHGVLRGVSLATAYNHLSRIAVSSGRVSRGALIGYSGTTGLSTGCHLHFETYENGTPVNPRRWL